MAEETDGKLNQRLDAIEAKLAQVADEYARLNSGLESLVKAQLLMGSLLETQQTTNKQAMIDAISNEVIAKITQQMGQDTSLLSDKLVGAIGTALGKRDAIDLADEAAKSRPVEVMWSALSQFHPGR